MKTSFLVCIFSMLLLPICAFSAETIRFLCDNGENVKLSYPDQDTAIMEYQGELLMLKNETAASTRYTEEGWQWWWSGSDSGELSLSTKSKLMMASKQTGCIVDRR